MCNSEYNQRSLENDIQPRTLFHSVINTSIDIFHHYFDREFVDLLTSQSNLYMTQKGKTPDVTVDEISTFLGILLISGYNQVPYRRMYWSADKDVKNKLIFESMRRDRFDFILEHVHFADNQQILVDVSDRFFKVRPLFDHMNKKSEFYPKSDSCCVDQAMIKHYGSYSIKQFIKANKI